MPLPDRLTNLWNQAAATGERVPIGRYVVCDGCNTDFTDSQRIGGLIFESKAFCPDCAPRITADAIRFGEESFIHAFCPDDKPFADFVREYRGPASFIQIERMPANLNPKKGDRS